MDNRKDRLEKLKKEKSLTQQQAADKADIPLKTYKNFMNGKNTELVVLERLADLFGVSTDYLLCRSDYRNIGNKEICEITGLSDEAVETLRVWQKPSKFLGSRPSHWTKLVSDLIEYQGWRIIDELWNYMRLHESRGRFSLLDAHKLCQGEDDALIGRYDDNDLIIQHGEASAELTTDLVDRAQLDQLIDAIKEYRKTVWDKREMDAEQAMKEWDDGEH